MRPGKPQLSQHNAHGFVLVAVLATMLILALSVQGVMGYVSEQSRRERENELIQIGEAYARAIGSYYLSSPGTVKRYPANPNDLLEDRRFVGTKRHLRQIYNDPITRANDWGWVRAADGGISGVYSTSELSPLRTARIELAERSLGPASRYTDWQFVFEVPISAPSKTP